MCNGKELVENSRLAQFVNLCHESKAGLGKWEKENEDRKYTPGSSGLPVIRPN